MNKSPGRPRKDAGRDARRQILECATALFGDRGYARTTLRGVAEAAQCDVALVSYYFGSKAGLFASVLQLTVAPAEVLRHAVTGDRNTFARRLATGLVGAWEDPRSAGQLRHLGRDALAHPDVRQGVSEYLDREVTTPLAEYLGGHHAHERAVAVLTLSAGFVFTRYILEVPSATNIPPQRAAAVLATQISAATRRDPTDSAICPKH